MSNTEHASPLITMSVDEYAAHIGIKRRAVMNYLAAGELDPAPVKDDKGRWRIAAHAVRVPNPAAAAMVRARGTITRLADAGVVELARPTPPPPEFTPTRRPFPITDAAAMFGVPVETLRRWAAAGVAGLELASGPHGMHYVWIEGR